jgi:hypothetical protein
MFEALLIKCHEMEAPGLSGFFKEAKEFVGFFN